VSPPPSCTCVQPPHSTDAATHTLLLLRSSTQRKHAQPGGAATLPVPAGDQGGAAAAVAEPFAVSGRRKPYVPLTPEDLCSTPVPADKMSLPQGYHWCAADATACSSCVEHAGVTATAATQAA
jgi:hypothetical protein